MECEGAGGPMIERSLAWLRATLKELGITGRGYGTSTAMPTDPTTDKECLYQTRLRRYLTALRNGKPDMVPIRPFVAEFTAKYAGYTCQEVAHDYELAFAAARKCAAEFDWDAVVSNMVYVWTGLTQVDRAEVLRHSRHRHPRRHRLPVPRAAAERRLHAAGRV